ncbi:restriction endonuclease subunit S [Arthrobacter flavus]|uniref:Restriction endonuclease subunit S n=1 Tax=Arthrobacter flavus TaxID=95172 RepID=A0ABW4QA93_9MICC
MIGGSTIGDLINTLIDYRGKTPSKTISGVPLITAKVIKGGIILDEPREYIAEDNYDAWMRRGLPASGDILITTEAPLGEVARVGTESRIALAQRVILLRPDPDKVDPSFMFHYLRSPQAQAALKRRSSGTTVSGIRQPELRALEVPLLTRPAQEEIGGVLDSIDDLIANNRRRVEVLEEMVRAVYCEWFVKYRYPGHGHVRMVDSALGPIPEGWAVGVIDDLLSIVRATVAPSTIDPDTPAVGLEHIPRQRVTLDDWGSASDQGSRKGVFARGDILFGKIRPYFHKVSIAPIDGICSTDAIIIRPSEAYWGQVVAVVSSKEFVANATGTSNGTKMPRADWKVIGQWPVVVPPGSLAEAFTGMARDQLGMAERLMLENRSLMTLRDVLLPKLVTGEIDVSTLDLHALLAEQAA